MIDGLEPRLFLGKLLCSPGVAYLNKTASSCYLLTSVNVWKFLTGALLQNIHACPHEFSVKGFGPTSIKYS